ncbi:aminotransferase class I/II-fold pyridoxal phosphate-dependent enzyme [Candidatus Chloroploca asiatica]|uniref:Aminotransferase n=1 Tax=Candidatus Chloroploca asiatica TaxID=1506545 RepID=A0A2H3L5K2_9CHLR|nr:aminotransferase class I/II-fold pyridoxal phosphate-dependent enzyme [Candidatus Chloroploca asiatica]PDW00219.1 aminotransferase [Candidatus Chloroploca asiatica]
MSSRHPAERVRGFGTTIFAEISALAVQCGAVNLGQGFPDFAGPAWVKAAAVAAVAADLNQYAPYQGLPRLREAVAATWQAQGRTSVDPAREITVTSGATEALFGAIQALVNPGDEVIIFEPFYDAYVPAVTMAGGVPRYVRLHPPGEGQASPLTGVPEHAWWFDPEALRAAFSPHTRILMLNTPHNPTGKVFRMAELELIASLCIEYDVTVIADEVYDQLVFGDAVHQDIASLPGMWERTLTINSIGKTFSVTGWKIGYAVGPAALNDALRAAHQWITFATATPLQDAAAAALEAALTNDYYEVLRAEYLERYALLRTLLHEAGLPTLPTEGSYFVMADLRETGFADDGAFCRWLTREIGVAAIPPSAFYAPRESEGSSQPLPLLARFCFAKKLETLRAAGERLAAVRFPVGG